MKLLNEINSTLWTRIYIIVRMRFKKKISWPHAPPGPSILFLSV
jgi:hypothetical protein